MLFVDGMLGVVAHSETVQWLYTLCASMSRLVVKTALKLLLVFVEYSENNAPLLIRAVNSVASSTGSLPWANLVSILRLLLGSGLGPPRSWHGGRAACGHNVSGYNRFICRRSCRRCRFSLCSGAGVPLSAVNQGPSTFTHRR